MHARHGHRVDPCGNGEHHSPRNGGVAAAEEHVPPASPSSSCEAAPRPFPPSAPSPPPPPPLASSPQRQSPPRPPGISPPPAVNSPPRLHRHHHREHAHHGGIDHGGGHVVGFRPLRARGCVFAAVVAALAALQFAAFSSRTTPPPPSLSSDETLDPRRGAGGGVALAPADGSSVAPRVLYLNEEGAPNGRDAATTSATGSKRNVGRKRRRQVELYPADYSDVTQAYPTADSSDFPFNDTIKRRDFPPSPSSDDDDGKRTEAKAQKCVPMAEWQTTFYPTCNAFHEMDAGRQLIGPDGRGKDIRWLAGAEVEYLGSGSWRDAWRIGHPTDRREKRRRARRRRRGRRRLARRRLRSRKKTTKKKMVEKKKQKSERPEPAPVVLKTWRYEHNFEDEYFEFNRVDAVVMERLTSSDHVVDVYGVCGLSLLTQFASASLTARADRLPPIGKLKLARDVARGLADVHGIADDDSAAAARNGGRDGAAALVHNDLNTAHVVLREGDATPLFNDFNVARLQLWDEEAEGPCGFETNLFSPQWRSPEEQRSYDNLQHERLTEKVDIYAFGNVCYRFATGQRAWRNGHGSLTDEYKAEIAAKKREGEMPPLPPAVRDSTDPAMQALLAAMKLSYEYDPADRPTARDLVTMMDKAIDEIESVETIG